MVRVSAREPSRPPTRVHTSSWSSTQNENTSEKCVKENLKSLILCERRTRVSTSSANEPSRPRSSEWNMKVCAPPPPPSLPHHLLKSVAYRLNWGQILSKWKHAALVWSPPPPWGATTFSYIIIIIIFPNYRQSIFFLKTSRINNNK